MTSSNPEEDRSPSPVEHPERTLSEAKWQSKDNDGGGVRGGGRLRVAVLYNLKENAPSLNGQRSKDALAELDTQRNVEDYAAAIRALGHDVVAFEGGADLAYRLAEHPVDICFNTCEGYRGDSREAQVSALLEMLCLIRPPKSSRSPSRSTKR
ncbi:MAG: putative D-alanine--D-alanine ligase [Anaerolineales bacterium]|nr:putative D-alanine--D-alanine ligase [Anaerolineales bacterium]